MDNQKVARLLKARARIRLVFWLMFVVLASLMAYAIYSVFDPSAMSLLTGFDNRFGATLFVSFTAIALAIFIKGMSPVIRRARLESGRSATTCWATYTAAADTPPLKLNQEFQIERKDGRRFTVRLEYSDVPPNIALGLRAQLEQAHEFVEPMFYTAISGSKPIGSGVVLGPVARI